MTKDFFISGSNSKKKNQLEPGKYKELDLRINSKSLIRYSNGLDVSAMGNLSEVEHDIFNTIFAAIIEAKKDVVKVNLNNIKNILKAQRKSNIQIANYLNDVFSNFVMLLKYTEKNYNSDQDKVEIKTSFLLSDYQISCSNTEAYIFFKLNNSMQKVFFDIQETFTQLLVTDVLSVKGKYAKALCHILARYFKGSVTLDIKEFRKTMGFNDSYKHSGMTRELDKAINILIDNKMYKYIHYDFDYGYGRGRPAIRIKLKFEKTADYDARLHGQGNLEGIEPVEKVEVVKADPEELKTSNKEYTRLKSMFCSCGGKIYYRLIDNGEKYQLFCENNKFYHEKLNLGGNGACNITEYKSLEDMKKLLNRVDQNDAKIQKKYTQEEINAILQESQLEEKYNQYLILSNQEITQISALHESQGRPIPFLEIINEKERLGIPKAGLKRI